MWGTERSRKTKGLQRHACPRQRTGLCPAKFEPDKCPNERQQNHQCLLGIERPNLSNLSSIAQCTCPPILRDNDDLPFFGESSIAWTRKSTKNPNERRCVLRFCPHCESRKRAAQNRTLGSNELRGFCCVALGAASAVWSHSQGSAGTGCVDRGTTCGVWPRQCQKRHCYRSPLFFFPCARCVVSASCGAPRSCCDTQRRRGIAV